MVKNYKEILFYPSIFILQEVHFPNRACSFTVKKNKTKKPSPLPFYTIFGKSLLVLKSETNVGCS